MKKFILVLMSSLILIGCDNTNNEEPSKDVLVNIENKLVEIESTLGNMDVTISTDFDIEIPVEVECSDENNHEALVSYFDSNERYTSEDDQTKITAFKEQVSLWEHLTEYDRINAIADMKKIKNNIHSSYEEVLQKYNDSIEELNTIKEEIVTIQTEYETLVTTNKSIRSEVDHLIKNVNKETISADVINKITTDSNKIATHFDDLNKTKGQISTLLDKKRTLIKNNEYDRIKETFNSIKTVIIERNTYLNNINEDLETTKTDLQ